MKSSPRDEAKFGAIDGAAIVVASVVGAGIFTVPSYVSSVARTPLLIISLWIGGGLLALAGAICYAELATRFPRGGAEYVYLREAFGETTGFLSGWTSFIAGFSGAIAAAAVGFAVHLTSAVPPLGKFTTRTIGIGDIGVITFSATTLLALALMAIFTLVSIAGVRASRFATNTLALLIVLGLGVLIFAGIGARATTSIVSGTATLGALSALVPVFFTYSGWNAAAYVAGEFRDPAKGLPRALIAGTLTVTVLYVALNLVLVRVLSPEVLAAAPTPVATVAGMILGRIGGSVTLTLVLAALASSVCALVITGPRIYREMARDGALPAVFAGSGQHDEPPKWAAVAQSLWSGLLVITGTFEEIVTYTGFAILLFSGAAVSAVIVLRRRQGPPPGYAVPAYPIVPLAFVVSVALIAVASFRYAPGPSLVGIALIAAGIPARLLTQRRRVGG